MSPDPRTVAVVLRLAARDKTDDEIAGACCALGVYIGPAKVREILDAAETKAQQIAQAKEPSAPSPTDPAGSAFKRGERNGSSDAGGPAERQQAKNHRLANAERRGAPPSDDGRRAPCLCGKRPAAGIKLLGTTRRAAGTLAKVECLECGRRWQRMGYSGDEVRAGGRG